MVGLPFVAPCNIQINILQLRLLVVLSTFYQVYFTIWTILNHSSYTVESHKAFLIMPGRFPHQVVQTMNLPIPFAQVAFSLCTNYLLVDCNCCNKPLLTEHNESTMIRFVQFHSVLFTSLRYFNTMVQVFLSLPGTFVLILNAFLTLI